MYIYLAAGRLWIFYRTTHTADCVFRVYRYRFRRKFFFHHRRSSYLWWAWQIILMRRQFVNDAAPASAQAFQMIWTGKIVIGLQRTACNRSVRGALGNKHFLMAEQIVISILCYSNNCLEACIRDVSKGGEPTNSWTCFWTWCIRR